MLIYLITNRVNGKRYVGQTVRFGLQARWDEHRNIQCGMPRGLPPSSAIGKAIQEYGAETFDLVSIVTATTKPELNAKENKWIAFYDTCNPEHGYNRNLSFKRKRVPQRPLQRCSREARQALRKECLDTNGRLRSQFVLEDIRRAESKD